MIWRVVLGDYLDRRDVVRQRECDQCELPASPLVEALTYTGPYGEYPESGYCCFNCIEAMKLEPISEAEE